MDKITHMGLERLEALIASWNGQKILVRVPLVGTAFVAFYGTLTEGMNDGDEPQFTITRTDMPSPTLVFQAVDVAFIMNPDKVPQIVLKNPPVPPVQNFDNKA